MPPRRRSRGRGARPSMLRIIWPISHAIGAGLRLVLMLAVSRLRFRVDLMQLLLLLVVSR